MVTIQVGYEGNLHCSATHEPSATTLTTDAPKDNQGQGESFSPTDLVATALGTCILTTMGIVARNHALDIAGATATVEKEMTAVPTRRIGSLATKIHMPHILADEHRQRLERAAHTCPVHKSLHPDVHAPIDFTWGLSPGRQSERNNAHPAGATNDRKHTSHGPKKAHALPGQDGAPPLLESQVRPRAPRRRASLDRADVPHARHRPQ